MINLDDLDGVVVSHFGDRIIPAKHFGKCPLGELTKEGFGTSQWSLSAGGAPLRDNQWTISIFNNLEGESYTQDRWVMPDVFRILFEMFEESGDKKRLNAILRALDL
jgi:hypothetical protein